MRYPKLHQIPKRNQLRSGWLTLVLVESLSLPLSAQVRTLETSYGAWRGDTVAVIWTAGYTASLTGPFDYGVAFTHLNDRRTSLNRTQSGAEITLGLGRRHPGPYAVAGAGLAMLHTDSRLDASWSAGGGYAAPLLHSLRLALEGRYRAEDQAIHGFWSREPSDRGGWEVSGRVILELGKGERRHHAMPSTGTLVRAARARGISRSDVAAQIVTTAVEAMGTPYRWGGKASNGYDCSGLIQYAYGVHGIALPRVSRDQAASGTAVVLEIARLAPGDILGFSVEGDRITHVGLYVGDGQFIHSASRGVQLSTLSGSDPDSLWWRRHWAAARRVLD